MLLRPGKDLWYFLMAFKGFRDLILFLPLLLLLRTILLAVERATTTEYESERAQTNPLPDHARRNAIQFRPQDDPYQCTSRDERRSLCA
jgi:hypothetical protein